mgnify:FL=1
MSYTGISSVTFSEITDLLLKISGRFEFSGGRYVVKKDQSFDRDMDRLKELACGVPQPLSSLLLSMADSPDSFFRSWTKAVDMLIDLSRVR